MSKIQDIHVFAERIYDVVTDKDKVSDIAYIWVFLD